MGFDCTLHVVDEGSLARFSARVLRGERRGGAFDADPESDPRLDEAKRLLVEAPEQGAPTLAALALAFVSTEAPHVYSRGFALSLWDEAVLGARPPPRLLGSFASHLPAIAAAYPGFAEHAPRDFDGNYSVGPFVAAQDVPAVRAHVERAIDALVPGRRAPYLPLLRVLRVAEARAHAYWEGTDLAVHQAHEEWLAAEAPQGGGAAHARVAPSPIASPLAAPLAIAGPRWLVHETWKLHDVDFSAFPPRVRTHEGVQITAAARTPWGTLFVRRATDPSVRPYVFSYLELAEDLAPAPHQPPALAIELPFEIGAAHATDDGVLLLPGRYGLPATLAAHVLRRDGLSRLALPTPACKPGAFECAAVPFGDGSWLLLWDRLPYRWDGRGAPEPLGPRPIGRLESLLAAVTLDDAAVLGAFGRTLTRVDRAGERSAPLPLRNVMQIARGPGSAVVLLEGDNPEADALKIYWQGEGAVTHVQPAVLGLTGSPSFVRYEASLDALIAASPGAWHAVDWSALAALPRVALKAFAKRHAAMAKKMR